MQSNFGYTWKPFSGSVIFVKCLFTVRMIILGVAVRRTRESACLVCFRMLMINSLGLGRRGCCCSKLPGVWPVRSVSLYPAAEERVVLVFFMYCDSYTKVTLHARYGI